MRGLIAQPPGATISLLAHEDPEHAYDEEHEAEPV